MEYLVTFFFLVSAHYFKLDHWLPWKLPHPARLILNYVIGTVGLVGPFLWVLYGMGEYELMMTLAKFVVVAGAAPTLCYLNDHRDEVLESLKKQAQKAREQEELAQAYKEQRDEQAGRK